MNSIGVGEQLNVSHDLNDFHIFNDDMMNSARTSQDDGSKSQKTAEGHLNPKIKQIH